MSVKTIYNRYGMELKELYQSDKTLFTNNIDKLKEILIKENYPKVDLDNLIKVLSTNFVSEYFYVINGTIHISNFNVIAYRISEKTDLSLDIVGKTLFKILEAMNCKVEGSSLDLMNKPMEED